MQPSIYFKPGTMIVPQNNDYCGSFALGYNGSVTAKITFRQTGAVSPKIKGQTLSPGQTLSRSICLGFTKTPQSVTATATGPDGEFLASRTMAVIPG